MFSAGFLDFNHRQLLTITEAFFGAGVVFSVVAVELLPDVVKTHAPVPLVVGFSVGFVAMIGEEGYTRKKSSSNAESGNKIPWSLMIVIAVDIFIDCLLLGIAFNAGNSEGILLAIALATEL